MSELAALVRFVHLTAAIVLAGGFGFRLFVARPAFGSAKDASATLEHFIQRSQPRNFRWSMAASRQCERLIAPYSQRAIPPRD